MYHRVAEPADDPYALAVRPAHFEQHVEHLRRRADVVPLTDWFEPSRAARIAVTFDDGYVDNATTAAPCSSRPACRRPGS
jgi:peptidoglycan/xylan/chitin deacetylase (PgdA/CDA1 family)